MTKINFIEIRREYPVPADQVYDAWTNPEIVSKWIWGSLGKNVKATIDAKSGGNYRITTEKNPGSNWKEPECAMFGVYETLEPGKSLVLSLRWDADMGYEIVDERVEVRFEESHGKTVLHFKHEGFPDDGKSAEGHKAGWNEAFDHLGHVLSGKVF
jgi:uncharacterized protein YndB with AHSA1/START domain